MGRLIVLGAMTILASLTGRCCCLDDEIKNRINEMAEAIMACRNIVGMNLAIVQGGETVFTQGYGVVDKEDNQPVTPQTLFGLASVTKQFTTTALALLLDEKG